MVPPYWINPALAVSLGPAGAAFPCDEAVTFPSAFAEPLAALGRSGGAGSDLVSGAPTCALHFARFSHSGPCFPLPCLQVRQHVSPSCPLYVGRSHPRVTHRGTGLGGGAGAPLPRGAIGVFGGSGATDKGRPLLALASAEASRDAASAHALTAASSRARSLVSDAGLRDESFGSCAVVGSFGRGRVGAFGDELRVPRRSAVPFPASPLQEAGGGAPHTCWNFAA